jgi:hypothetical protein
VDDKRIRIDLWLAMAFTILALGAGVAPGLARELEKIAPPEHYKINIDPKAAEKDLLPIPPQHALPRCVSIPSSLADVPEVQLHEPVLVRALKPNETASDRKHAEFAEARKMAIVHNARLTTQINHLNKKKTDHFMELLVAHRADLAGMPFVMGDACRLKAGERLNFKNAVQLVQTSIQFPREDGTKRNAEGRWQEFDRMRGTKTFQNVQDPSCTAACMQMLALEKPDMSIGLIRRLATYDKTESDNPTSIQALTKLAVFSQEKEVRDAAIAALRKRGGADSTILLRGLRYPWPSVAQNAAEAASQLKRTDLIPELVKMLEEPDPRAPVVQAVDGKNTAVIREVVRINHHRNCLLCHPPGNTPDVMKFETWGGDRKREFTKGVDVVYVNITKQEEDVLVGAIPTPGDELPSFGGYREFTSPDLLIRADITYLRQDFSLAHKVPNAYPWPEMQRFDFLVRSRVLSEQHAEAYRAEFALHDEMSPYRQSALVALRGLTGRDAGVTASAWRAALAIK